MPEMLRIIALTISCVALCSSAASPLVGEAGESAENGVRKPRTFGLLASLFGLDYPRQNQYRDRYYRQQYSQWLFQQQQHFQQPSPPRPGYALPPPCGVGGEIPPQQASRPIMRPEPAGSVTTDSQPKVIIVLPPVANKPVSQSRLQEDDYERPSGPTKRPGQGTRRPNQPPRKPTGGTDSGTGGSENGGSGGSGGGGGTRPGSGGSGGGGGTRPGSGGSGGGGGTRPGSGGSGGGGGTRPGSGGSGGGSGTRPGSGGSGGGGGTRPGSGGSGGGGGTRPGSGGSGGGSGTRPGSGGSGGGGGTRPGSGGSGGSGGTRPGSGGSGGDGKRPVIVSPMRPPQQPGTQPQLGTGPGRPARPPVGPSSTGEETDEGPIISPEESPDGYKRQTGNPDGTGAGGQFVPLERPEEPGDQADEYPSGDKAEEIKREVTQPPEIEESGIMPAGYAVFDDSNADDNDLAVIFFPANGPTRGDAPQVLL